jgi:5-methylthioadenosine/S-adenosylhomocysteine deaminase
VCAEVAEASGMRITFSPQLIDDPGGPDGPGETLESTLAFIDEWHDRSPERIRTWFGPHSLYSVRPDTFRAIREHADRYGIGIHTHLAESRAETAIVAERSGGRTPTEWLDELVGLGPDVLVAHAVELDDTDLARLAAARVGIGHCPTSNAKLGNRRARVVDLLAAGAVVGLGTDSNMTNNNLDMFEEMRMAALVQKQMLGDPAVLPSAQVLRMATMGSARALGLDRDIGSIEVGKAADLAVVDLRGAHARPLVRPIGGRGASNVVEQLVWSCSAADVRHTVVTGVTVMEDRRLTTIDVAEAVTLADAAAVDLWRSAGVFERRFGSDAP